jgi:MoaA/NifB/PqqE/SkfB family radical SAM enzyme
MKVSYLAKQALKDWYKFPCFWLTKYNSSLLSLLPTHPSSACINATHNCNSRCITCTMWKSKSDNELTTSEMIEVLKQLRQVGVRRVGWSGGEPLLRKDLPLLIREAKSLGFEKINVLTNSLLLTEEKAVELLENGLERMSIPLDGIGEANDTQRNVKGAFEKTIGALKILAHLRDTKYPYFDITVSTTLTGISIAHVPEIVDLCRQFEVTWIPNTFEIVSFQFKDIDKNPLVIKNRRLLNETFDYLHEFVGKKPLSPLITHIGLEHMKNYLLGEVTPEIKRKVPCTAGFQAIYIDAYGNVYPGCWALPPMGCLREKGLPEIIFSTQYKRQLQRMFAKKCPYCTNSLLVNIWYYPPSILSEIPRRAIKG